MILAFALLIGCDKSDTKSGAAAPLKELRLGYFANATHAQAVLGVDSGDFARAISPAKLSTKVFNAGPSLIEALFAKEVDIGYVGPGPALSAYARSHGEGVRVISGAAANGVVLVARKDSGINSVKDLLGKRLATPQKGNTQDISARHYMASWGQRDDSTILPVANAEQSSMMARGQIDAAWAPEPWGARLVAETDAKIIGEEKDLWPNGLFSLTVIITTPEFLQAHPDVVERILAVHGSWTRKLQENPTAQLPLLEEALFKLTQKKLPPGVLAAALPRIRFGDDPLKDTFQTMGQWAYELHFASEPPGNLDKLFDLTILRKLEQQQQQQPAASAPPVKPG
ncbi:MAG TPA: aliphatic sulfonate ABC transporter substrate-binding protein [Tepidisphaeraceae bacterium]